MNTFDYDMNNDYGEMIDMLIFANDVKNSYRKGNESDWIMKIDNEDMRAGLKQLSKRQLRIIEDFVFKGKNLMEISEKYGMTYENLLYELKKMRITLIKYL